MTILRKIENPLGDDTGFVERIQHENNVEASGVATSNYNDLKDKPLINGVILQGRLSLDDLYIQEKGDYAKADEIPTKISELENDKGYVTEVPTKISELENDKNYITEYAETDPTVPQYVKNIKEEDIAGWNAKSEFSGNYDDLNNKPEIPSIAGLATEEYVNNAISKIPPTDLTGYATLDDVDDAITEIVGAAPETLDTLAELAEGLVANRNVVEVLNDAIEQKANSKDLASLEDSVDALQIQIDNMSSELPIASVDALGGIKVGENLEITEDGTLNAKDYFPTGTSEVALSTLPLGLHYAPTGRIVYKPGGSVFDTNTSTPRIIMKNTDNSATMFSAGTNGLTIKVTSNISGGSRTDNSISYRATDSLTSTSTTASLSAKQGKVLNDKIAELQGEINSIKSTLEEINNTLAILTTPEEEVGE